MDDGGRTNAGSRRLIVLAALVISLVPLVALTYLAITVADRAVTRRASDGLRVEASISALYVAQEMSGLGPVDEAFARRPLLIRTLASGRPDAKFVRATLDELSRVRPGIGTAFLTRPDGTLVDIVPSTPAIVGRSFAFRDWYHGVRRRHGTYVSTVYQTAAADHATVVAVATPVRSRGDAGGRLLGYLVVAYRTTTVDAFARRFARTESLAMEVTDQAGVPLTGVQARDPASGRDRPVTEALAGQTGVARESRAGHDAIVAWAPVPELGWSVVTAQPAAYALRDLGSLRRTVVIIAGLLGLILLAGVWLLSKLLRELDRREKEVHTTARTDVLTKLPNRRAWDEALPRELARSRRDGRPFTVALIDLDHFKRFNDTGGHRAGDDLLASIAPAWTPLLRETDLLARYGGEEFALALPECDGPHGQEVVARILDAVPAEQTCSAGVAEWDGQETGEDLVARSDEALYQAKREGRARAVMAVPRRRDPATR